MFDVIALKAAMAEKGMGVMALSVTAGVNYSALVNILNSKTNPTLVTVGRLAKALNINPRELFKEEGA